MSDKMPSGDSIKADSTDVTTYVLIRSTGNNREVTGKIFSDFTLSYVRTGAVAVGGTEVTQTVTGAHVDWGIVEVDAVNAPGLYRIDWPDAAFASGVDEVILAAVVTGAYASYRTFGITTNVVQTADGEANIVAVNGDATAAQKIQLGASTMVVGTIDDSMFVPSPTEFETDITEATADHYVRSKGRRIIFTTGALKDQAVEINAYSLVGALGHFTVATMTEAPASGDTFVIV